IVASRGGDAAAEAAAKIGRGAVAHALDTADAAALNAITILFANALRGDRVLVNCADPGWVRTDMGGRAASRKGRIRSSGWPRFPTTARPAASSTTGNGSSGKSTHLPAPRPQEPAPARRHVARPRHVARRHPQAQLRSIED